MGVQTAENLLQGSESSFCGINTMLYEMISVKHGPSYTAHAYRAFCGLKVLKIITLLAKVVYSAKE